MEASLVASVAGRDRSSTTGINLAKIQAETGLNPFSASPRSIRRAFEEREETVPPSDLWRIPFLVKLLKQRKDMELNCVNTDKLNDVINGLCST